MTFKRAGRFLPSDLDFLRRNDKPVGRDKSRRARHGRTLLSIERCEERCLMAANDISGIKFEDLTGDGFTGDDTPLGGFDIQLFQDDGDGVFDPVADGPPINTQTTDAVTGAYTFLNVPDGKYFIQEVQQAGFVQTAGPPFYTVNVVGGCVFADNAFTVDNFNLPDPATQYTISLLNPDPTLIKNAVAGVVGGERDVFIDVSGAPGLNTAIGAVGFNGGQGIFRGTFNVPGTTATLEYDGLDADIPAPPAALVNNEGLAADLTNGGINTGFRIDTFALDVGSGTTMDFQILLTGPGGETASLDSVLTEDITPHVEFFPFASFTTSGGFSFANVTSIRVVLNPPNGMGVVAPNVDFILDAVFTDRLQPDDYNFGNFHLEPDIDLTKTVVIDPTCVVDIDGSGPVPVIPVGGVATFEYVVTNTGFNPLEIDLQDDNGTPLNLLDDIDLVIDGVVQPGVVIVDQGNGDAILDVGEFWTLRLDFTLNTPGLYTNVASTVGIALDANGQPIANAPNAFDVDDETVFVAEAGINIEKRVNGQDANVEPPLFERVLPGTAVNYTYLVTNTGNVILDISSLSDDNATPGDPIDDFAPTPVLQGGFNIGDADQDGRFDPSESWEFEAIGIVLNTLGLITNTASVTGTPVDINGVPIDPTCVPPAEDDDPANIVVVDPSIDLTKEVIVDPLCVIDVDGTGPVPVFQPGDLVTYQYTIENTGSTDLDVSLVDDAGTADPIDDFDVLAFPGVVIVESGLQDGLLNVGETWTVTIQLDPMVIGYYENIAVVTGTPLDDNGDPIANIANVFDIDDAVAYFAVVDVELVKLVNGNDANVEPPAFETIVFGTPVDYTYLLTNTGNVALTIASFVDDNGTPGLGDDFTPTPVVVNGFVVGDADQDNVWDPGETLVYEELGVVIGTFGLHTNIATINVDPADFEGFFIERECLPPAQDSDPANIIVIFPAIDLIKDVIIDPVCVVDIDGSGPVPVHQPGDLVTYQYSVQNTGTVDLDLQLIDDNGTPGNLGDDFDVLTFPGVVIVESNVTDGILNVGEVWTITIQLQLNTPGYYENIATATGTPLDGNGQPITNVADVVDVDPAAVFLAVAGINIEKRVNGQDANVEPPAFETVPPGTAVNYTYFVTNTGNVILDIANFIDDNGTPGDLGDDFTPTPVLQGGFNIGDADQDNRFDPSESWEFEQIGVVLTTLGLHTNIASVTGNPVDINGLRIDPQCVPPVQDDDPANIVVAEPGITLVKEVIPDPLCVLDIDGTGPVPVFEPGDVATYQYTVANTGTQDLAVTLVDDNGTPANLGDDFDVLTFPGAIIVESGVQDGLLNVGETWTVTIQLTLNTPGFYINTATVTGTPLEGQAVTDIDDAAAFIAVNDITIQKLVNSKDANSEPPAFDHVLQGTAVNYTYLVTNHGNVIINLNNFVDDNGTPGNLGDDFQPTPVLLGGFNVGDADLDNRFDPSETWEFEKQSVVLNTLGLHTNIASVKSRAVDFNGANIDPECVGNDNAQDPANIIVDLPAITLQKEVVEPECIANVDGQGDAPLFAPGDPITYRYTIRNTGTTPLIVNLTDVNDNGTPVNPADDITKVLLVNGVAQPGATLSGDSNVNGRLDTTETWRVTFTSTLNTLGFNTNEGDVTGTPTNGQGQPLTGFAQVTAEAEAVVYIATSGINIEKRVNGQDANVEPPPFQHVTAGDSVSYTYFVTNTGNVILNFVSLIDDGGPQASFSPSGVLKPNTRNIGDADDDGRFDPGESWEFERINFVIDANTPDGPFTNTVTVIANPVEFDGTVIPPGCLPQVTDTDPATVIIESLDASLSGFVYEDCNNNGIYEPGMEFPIADVTILLFQNGAQIDTTVTDTFGKYLFDDLPAGTYQIREVQPAGFLDGLETLGTVNGNPVGNINGGAPDFDRFANIDLAAGQTGINYNFGELEPSSIAGCVYFDVNNNGFKDGSETAIPGVEIKLDGTDDRGNAINLVAFTDVNGNFIFNGLRPANANGYRLQETQPVNMIDGKDKAGTKGGLVNSAQDRISNIPLLACETATDYCFGEFSLIIPDKRPFIFARGEWQNQNNAFDVNQDGQVNNQDALIVIDALNRKGIGKLPNGVKPKDLVDIDGNDILEPADLLQIIGHLNVKARVAPNVRANDNNNNGAAAAQAVLADQVFSEMETTAQSNDNADATVTSKKSKDSTKKSKTASADSQQSSSIATSKKSKTAASTGSVTVLNRARM